MRVNGGPVLIFFCHCGRQLTRAVRKVSQPDWVPEDNGQPAVPEGTYWVADAENYFTAGEYVVRLESIIEAHYAQDWRRRQGCCGIDGLNGMNRVCRCGREIGTERSDCWTPHGVGLDPRQVLISDNGGKPFSPVPLPDRWLVANGHIPFELAVTVAEGSLLDGLPILADALEEAGFDNRSVLVHLREPHPHPYCWFLDSVADKRHRLP